MVSSPLSSKMIKSHTRSISLPNRSHPLIPQFNEHLQRVRPCDDATTTSSFPSIAEKLKSLDDLYNCVDELLLLPQTRQVFAKEYEEKWVDETLNGYLRLVDTCATAKDFVFQAKQDVQDLLSSLRRRHVHDLHGFLTSRKRVKKMINKCIGSFKNKPTFLGLEKNQETIAIISMLKEADSATLELIEVLLSSISGKKGCSRTSGWSLVSKMIHRRKHSCNNAPEFEELDATVCKLVGLGSSNDMQTEELQSKLKEMELNIQVVGNRLESLFKRLIRTRVSLLNMQSQ